MSNRSLMSKPSLPFPLAAFEFLTNALVLVYYCICLWCRDRRVCRVFQKLLKSVLHPEERLVEFSNEEAMAMVQGQPEHQVENGTTSRGALDGMLRQRGYVRSGMFKLHAHVASSQCSSIWSQVQNGVLSARSDDTKSLKGVGLDWISPRDISLNPPVALARNVNRRRCGQCSHPMTVQVCLLSRPH